MDAFLESLKEAHEEVMNATGWGVFFSGEGQKWSMSPIGAFQQFRKEVAAFISAVNWWEPYFRYLALFHLTVAVTVVLTTWRASIDRIFVVTVLLLLVVWGSSYLNEWGSSHASQIFVEKGANYFDPSGLFIMVTLDMPLFLLVLWLQARAFLQLLRLMVVVKRNQIKREMEKFPCGRKGERPAASSKKKT